MNLKKINLGALIKQRIKEMEIDNDRICNYLTISEDELLEIYEKSDIDTENLLKFSKILKYDFFRLYSQHLMLYSSTFIEKDHSIESSLPSFRKNIYSREIIDFILRQIASGKMTKSNVILKYNIPKTTLYKWIKKYDNDNDIK